MGTEPVVFLPLGFNDGARLTKNALNTLHQRQVNILGLILNCIDSEMPDYYYYRYPKYYAAS